MKLLTPFNSVTTLIVVSLLSACGSGGSVPDALTSVASTDLSGEYYIDEKGRRRSRVNPPVVPVPAPDPVPAPIIEPSPAPAPEPEPSPADPSPPPVEVPAPPPAAELPAPSPSPSPAPAPTPAPVIADAPTIGNANLNYHAEDQTVAATIDIPLGVSNNNNGGIVLVGQATYLPFNGGNFPAPVDNFGNFYSNVVPEASYRGYSSVGNAVFSTLLSAGDKYLNISVPKAAVQSGEITVNAVHIPNGRFVTAAPRAYPSAGEFQRSGSVTTTGPAVLVAWWWGDGSSGTPHFATPGNGFQIISALTLDGNLAQCTVAIKVVDRAGTYDVTWFSGSGEGAMLALVAVQ